MEWQVPLWMHRLAQVRKTLFLQTVEPIIVALLGPVDESDNAPYDYVHNSYYRAALVVDPLASGELVQSESHRRLGFLPNYVANVKAFKETSMSFATLFFLFGSLSFVFLIFLSCFYHNQKTSPLFISPRRHRLPKLVPPPLPVEGVSNSLEMLVTLLSVAALWRLIPSLCYWCPPIFLYTWKRGLSLLVVGILTLSSFTRSFTRMVADPSNSLASLRHSTFIGSKFAFTYPTKKSSTASATMPSSFCVFTAWPCAALSKCRSFPSLSFYH